MAQKTKWSLTNSSPDGKETRVVTVTPITPQSSDQGPDYSTRKKKKKRRLAQKAQRKESEVWRWVRSRQSIY